MIRKTCIGMFVMVVMIGVGITSCGTTKKLEIHPRVEWKGGLFDNTENITKATINLDEQKTIDLQKGSLDFSEAEFVDDKGNAVKQVEMVTIEYDRNNLVSSGIDFRFRDSNQSGIFESDGMLDLDFAKDSKKLSLKQGSSIQIKYPVNLDISKDVKENMCIYSYNKTKNVWEYESKPILTNIGNREFYDFNITDLSYWNVDYLYTDYSCIKGKVVIKDNKSKLPITIIASGISYTGMSIVKTINNNDFAVDVKLSSEVKIFAVCYKNKTAARIRSFVVGNKRGSSSREVSPNYKYDAGEMILTKEMYNTLLEEGETINIGYYADDAVLSDDLMRKAKKRAIGQ